MKVRIDFENEKYEDEPESFFSAIEISERSDEPVDTWVEVVLQMLKASTYTRENIIARTMSWIDHKKFVKCMTPSNRSLLMAELIEAEESKGN